jgi:DNA polymerase-3 subunit alpha
MSREKLLGNLERAVEFVQKQKEDRQFGQASLFEDSGEKEYVDFIFEEFPEISRFEKLKSEKQLIGFYLSGHPMDEYRDIWEKAVKIDLGRLAEGELNVPETGVILIGIIKAVKEVNAKSGKMAYVTIADFNGEIEMIFFPKVWERCRDNINIDDAAFIRGKIDYQQNRDKYSFIADAWIDNREIETAITEREASRQKWEKFRQIWLYMADLKGGSLLKAEKGSYTVIGELVSLREKPDKKGNDMAFGTLRDFEGDIDLVFFSKAWSECRNMLNLNEFVALKGSFDPQNDFNPQKPSFKVSSIADMAALSRSAARKANAGEKPQAAPLASQAANTPANAALAKAAAFAEPAPVAENLQSPAPPSIHIHLDGGAITDSNIRSLRDYLSVNRGPCPVYIHIDEKTIRANSGLNVTAMEDAVAVLENCAGVTKVWKEQ